MPITFLTLSEEITIEEYSSDRVMVSSTIAKILSKNSVLNAADKKVLSSAVVVLEHNDNNEPILFAKVAATGTVATNKAAKSLAAWAAELAKKQAPF